MKKSLLTLSALALLALASCGGSNTPSSSSDTKSEETSSQSSTQEQPSSTDEQPSSTDEQPSTTSEDSSDIEIACEIKNEDALKAQWYVGDPDRTVELDLTPKCNIQQALAKGDLVITSSNEEVVKVMGRQLKAVGEGDATITVTYLKDGVDTVLIHVDHKQTNKEKYGIEHEGTLEDPLTNTDAIKVGEWCKENGNTPEALYVKGEVDTFYHAPGSRDDGAVSWYLKELVAGEGKFEVYKCYKEVEGEQVALTDKDIWKGATAIAHGIITYYKDGKQVEFTSAVLDSVEGEPPADPIEIPATVAKTIEDGKTLTDGDSSWDYYVTTGYVVKKSGNNFFLADSKTADTSDDKALYELYGVPSADQGKLLKGAKVTVKTKIKNYHGQIENGGKMEITLVEEGEAWEIVYVEKTVDEAIAITKALGDGKTTEVYYKITGVVQAITEEYSSFGNMSFTVAGDSQETLTVFRLKMSAAKAAGIVVGNSVTFGGQLKNYVKDEVHTYELVNGVLFGVKDAEGADVISYGTKEAPLSVNDLLTNEGTLCKKEQAAFSEERVTVKGLLISATYSESYGTWTLVLADSAKGETIKCTGVTLAEEVAKTVAPNDTVIVSHYLEYYGGSWSLYFTKTGDVNNYGSILERSKVGKATITVSDKNEHATVTGLVEGGQYNNDDEVSFSVTPDEGYEIVSVEIYGKTLTPTEGKYKFAAAGDGAIVVKVKEAGVVTKKVTVSVDSLGQPSQAYTAEVKKVVDELSIVSANVGNYGNGLQYRVKNGVASNIYNDVATTSAIKSITVTQSSTMDYVAAAKEFLTISAGAAAITAPVDADVVKGSDAVEGVWTVDFSEEDNFTFFSVGHHSKNSGAVYISSIVVELY